MENLVTVVVPVYKVEKYLERCLDSIVNQTYKNLEIILVDDGSPDNCPKLCDGWQKKDKRIKVIHKENQGLGMARNTGIENSTGEYICFVDSDDYIDKRTIELSLQNVIEKNSDICVYGYNRVLNDGNLQRSFVPCVEKQEFEGEEVLEDFLPKLIEPTVHNSQLSMSACTCLISMKIVQNNNWRFVSERDIISEDVYSLLGLYKWVNCVSILKEPLYYYCENQSSLTQTYREDRYEKNKYFYDCCYKLCEGNGYCDSVMKSIAGPYLSNTIATLKKIMLADFSPKEKREKVKKIITDEHLKNVIKNSFVKKDSRNRRILLTCIGKGMYNISYILLKLKGR